MRRRYLTAILRLVACATTGCTTETEDPFVCEFTQPTECPDPAPHYADVEPIFQNTCQECHALDGDQWPLDTYGHVADWNDLIRDELRSCTMPPPDSGVRLEAADRELILTWLLCGFPE